MSSKEKNEFAENNIELVYHVVNKFKNTGHQFDDLVGVGMVGFTRALNTYKKGMNAKISTYSVSCIRNEILHFLRKEKKHIVNNVSSEVVIYKHSDGNTITLADVVTEEALKTEDEILILENIEELMYEIEMLTDREKLIIEHRFELNGKELLKQEELGEILDMTQANVSKIETSTIKKLAERLKEKNIDLSCFEVGK